MENKFRKKLKSTGEYYQTMAELLPDDPPLGRSGESSLEEFRRDLPPEEIATLYVAYKALDGRMGLWVKDAVKRPVPHPFITRRPADGKFNFTDEHLQSMAILLPIQPLEDFYTGESVVEEFCPDLTPEELEKVYVMYQERGGKMALHRKDENAPATD